MVSIGFRTAGLAAALACALSSGVVQAQAITIEFPPGTLIANGRWEVMKIVQCGLKSDWGYTECSFEVWREGSLVGGGLRRMEDVQLLKQLNSVRETQGLLPLTRDQASGRAPYPEAAGAPAQGPAAPADVAPGGAPTGGNVRYAPIPPTQYVKTNPVAPTPQGSSAPCPKTPYVELPGTLPANTALFRQVLESGHTFQRSAFLWTGVTFESVSVGAPIKNKITMQPGVGPRRVTDAAPVDTLLYPVRSTYVLCHQYSSGPDRTRVQTGDYCFVSRTGKWACGSDSSVAQRKTTPLG
ncbi:MAG: hypothetical protein EOP62_14980 [Sphingomonadales bacterium]|nr:MAG: hypothetical protein EOP62_14980 [Sphingomonadales bacterium]